MILGILWRAESIEAPPVVITLFYIIYVEYFLGIGHNLKYGLKINKSLFLKLKWKVTF